MLLHEVAAPALELPRHRDGRRSVDGTWGWDYVGFGHRPGRVFLDYWHGRPQEPAYGSYATDGPEVPDPIGARPVQKFLNGEKRKEREEGGP